MAIIKCPECGHQISEKATVCPICGVEIAGNIVKCSYCGEVYFRDDGICPHCYRSLPHNEHGEDENPLSEESSIEKEDNGLPKESSDTPVLQKEMEETLPGGEEEKVDVESEKEEDIEDVEVHKVEESEETGLQTNANQPQEEKMDDNPSSVHDGDDVEEEESYIDTDDENLEKPVHEDEDKDEEDKGKHKYIPVVVSLAIAALIAAVCLYFYNASKLDTETRAFKVAMESNDVREMQNFLRNFTDATSAHKQAIQDKIASINKQKDDLSLSLVTRDKVKIQQFLKDYPDTPQRQTLLAMVDSIDWEEATKTNTKESYERYLEAHAGGLFAKEAKDKITVKVVEATAEDEAKAKSLFREFFLSVNGNDASRLSATLNAQLTSFLGTNNPGSGEVVAWMKRQHKDDVSNVIWKLNHDYKITKREQNNIKESTVDFTAKQTIVYKDGRSSSEHFKVTSLVTENNKISSMTMTKYVPKPGEQSTTSSSSGSSSTGSSKPSASTSSSNSQSSKPSSNGASTSKPSSTSSTSKPSGASNTTKPSGSSNTSKPSGASNTTKPTGSSNTSKPTGSSSTSKPTSSSNTSKPTGSSSTSKPTSSSNTSKPSGSNSTSKPSGSNSTSKPSGSNNTSKPSSGTNKASSTQKPAASQSASPKK